jgi:hypothetical protein
MGRPSDFNADTVNKLCSRISHGESLKAICRDEDMPDHATVYRWLAAHAAFRDLYACAKEDSADALADEIIDIADDGSRDYTVDEDGREVVDHDHIQRSKLRVDARKWIASKLKPRKYGDKVEQTHKGDAAAPIMITSTDSRL